MTVTDNFGCTDSETFSITEQPAPQPELNAPAPICDGESSEIEVQNPVFEAYEWSNGGNGTSITVSNSGIYTVTVTDAAGCTGTESVTLTVNPSPNVSATQQAFDCDGQRILSATLGFPNYAWSNGASGANIVVTEENIYEVTVTGAFGCTGTAAINAEIPPAPEVQIAGTTVICAGENTTFSATAGFSFYEWSSGQNSQNITLNSSGTYFVTVTDAFGCTAEASQSLGVTPAPVPEITGPTQICAGGTATFTATGGVFASYLWSTGDATASISTSNAGNYSLTVTDAAGCTATADINLSIGTALNIDITELPYNCNGQIVLDAGAGFQTYNWSNSATTQTISVTTNDDFSVTVSDATGCSGAATISVNIPDLPQVGITGVPEICNGTTTTLSATGGFAAYTWSIAQFNPTITVGLAGDYGVTVTDANGCTASATFNLAVATAPEPTILGTSTICENSSATLSLAAAFNNYNWSTGANTPAITVSVAGNYAVTVTNAAGCTGSDDFFLNVNSSLQPQITQQPYVCDGQITLDAGAGFQTYLWSNAANTQTINVLQNENYAVTVSDAGGCTGTAAIAVTVPAAPQVSILGNENFCDGGSTVISATAGFTNYNWSNGASTAQIEVFQAGNFGLTVSDASGCTAAANFVAMENPPLQVQILGSTTLCNGSAATLSASQNFQNYAWSTGETVAQIAVSVAGTVGLTVTDAAGCTASAAVNLTVANSLSPQISAQPYLCNGQITLDAGAGFQTYLWSNAANTQTINVLQNENYAVTVSDAGGCTGTAAIAVTVPAAPQVSILGNENFCDGGSTVISATAGFTNYNWSNGASTAQIEVFQVGNYDVTVSDGNGCTATAAISVTEKTAETPEISGSSAICVGGSTLLSVLNAANFSQILWSSGSTAAQISVAAAGNFSVTATDASGCTASAEFGVTVGNNLAPTIDENAYLCDGNITLEAPAGFETYVWSNGGDTATISVSADGNYALTVTDATGCTGTASVFVEVPDEILVVVQTPPIPICPGGSAQLSVAPGFANYQWSTGEAGNAVQISTAGNYAVTVTDANGCTAIEVIEVLKIAQATTFADTLEFSPGEVLNLSPLNLNFSPANISWSPVSILNCTDCLTVEARPTETVQVDFSGISGDCTHKGYFYLIAKEQKEGAVFAPNAISLSSLDNASFTLFGNELVLKINYLRIFTRWGELVVELNNLAPGDVSQGWKGDFRGRKVDVGVFVWVAEVLLSDGSVEIFKGDVTVLR